MADKPPLKLRVKNATKAVWNDSLFWQILRAGATAGALWKATVAIIASLSLSAIMYQSGKQVAHKQAVGEIMALEVAFN